MATNRRLGVEQEEEEEAAAGAHRSRRRVGDDGHKAVPMAGMLVEHGEAAGLGLPPLGGEGPVAFILQLAGDRGGEGPEAPPDCPNPQSPHRGSRTGWGKGSMFWASRVPAVGTDRAHPQNLWLVRRTPFASLFKLKLSIIESFDNVEVFPPAEETHKCLNLHVKMTYEEGRDIDRHTKREERCSAEKKLEKFRF